MSEKIDELYSKYQETKTAFTGTKFYCPVGEIEAITWTVYREQMPIYTMGMKGAKSFVRGRRHYHGSISFAHRVMFGTGDSFNIKMVNGADTRTMYGVTLTGEAEGENVYEFTAIDIGPVMITKPEEFVPDESVTLDYDEDYIDGIDMLDIGSEGVSPYDLSIEIEQSLDPHTIDIASMIFGWIEEGLLEFKDGKIYRV